MIGLRRKKSRTYLTPDYHMMGMWQKNYVLLVDNEELELNRTQTPAVSAGPPKRTGFTSTSVPRFSGKSNWEHYRQVFEAIVRSNGWDGVTAALQLLSHLDGDALNVALLVPESQQVLSEFLLKSLSDHQSSPG